MLNWMQKKLFQTKKDIAKNYHPEKKLKLQPSLFIMMKTLNDNMEQFHF